MANPIPSAAQPFVSERRIITVPWMRWLSSLPTTGTSPVTWNDVASGVGFKNGWSNFGGLFANAAYTIDASGIVYLRGVITGGTVGAVPAFTLPAGFLPLAQEQFPISSAGAFGQCVITATGDVRINVGTNTTVSLSGITFGTT